MRDTKPALLRGSSLRSNFQDWNIFFDIDMNKDCKT
jgi:hypothetical protein